MTAKPSRLPRKRILLAEDDESMRSFLERALTKAGYEVIAFANGKDAHERLQEEPFTLLLTDIVMPQMDGIELARGQPSSTRAQDHVHHRLRGRDPEYQLAPAERRARAVQPFHLKDLVREIDRLLAI
jgi:two-component system cell cycle response regulator CpdR